MPEVGAEERLQRQYELQQWSWALAGACGPGRADPAGGGDATAPHQRGAGMGEWEGMQSQNGGQEMMAGVSP